MSPDVARRWIDEQIGRLGRGAQPSHDLFPSQASLVPLEQAPAEAQAARAFYQEACFDWGGAWIHRYAIDGDPLFVVFVGTDGDAGWLELYDADGGLLGAATLTADAVHWEERDVARARVGTDDFPA